jgi:spore coat protein CotF
MSSVTREVDSDHLLGAQEISNTMYGHQNMESDSPEVLMILSALTPEVQSRFCI